MSTRYDLLSDYEIVPRGEGPNTFLAELLHVERNEHGGSVSTPLGWLSAALLPWFAEQPEHWEVHLFLDNQNYKEFWNDALPSALATWLEQHVGLAEPYLLTVAEAREIDAVERGNWFDDE